MIDIVIPALTYMGITYEVCSASELLDKGVPSSAVEPAAFQQAVIDKKIEICEGAQAAFDGLTSDYPGGEIATFDKQEQEARAYVIDSTAPTPIIDAIIAESGAAKSDQIARVIKKADDYEVVAGKIVGKRQRLEKQLGALSYPDNTVADVVAIKW